MNTNPDDTKLAMWLDDELHGEELAAFEAGAGSQPELRAARAEVRRCRELLGSALPAAEEPPYPDFFNHRVARAIHALAPQPAVVRRRFSWSSLVMPLAACAGMALAFWLGVKSHAAPADVVVAGAPRAIPVEPFVYTPESGVMAEYFASTKASATVIVLNGVAAIPDSIDFSSSSSRLDAPRASEATAVIEPENNDSHGL
jgi:anti-sigma factor RsiW